MKKIIASLLLAVSLAFAQEPAVEEQAIAEELTTQEQEAPVVLKRPQEIIDRIYNLGQEISAIDKELKDNILLKRYSNYEAYRKISKELEGFKADLKNAEKRGEQSKELQYQLNNKIRIKENELELINEYKDSPIGSLINPPEIEAYEAITNPFGIINALSYIKKMENHRAEFETITEEMEQLQDLLEKKLFLYLDLYNLDTKDEFEERINELDRQKKDVNIVLDIMTTTKEVYNRKLEQVILETKSQISTQVEKTLLLLSIIVGIFLFSFVLKLTLKKYFSQNENYYMINKIINFILVFLIIMILLLSYIDNVSYIITILGFASAGIAIALKDWFMSIFGWMVIVTSGSITVGDRIKVTRDGQEVVGDVLDISLFKITIREDITLTSYMVNRRTGRIFFIPNNYIFSEMIANYTHSGLRTVWDGIDITITFDSNYKKAQHIAKDILKHYSKGYADITRNQLGKLRSKYSLRATGVEPRVFTFVESYGIVISAWYLTNSYSALVLRSTMSPEILEAFMKEDDITIAFPTHTVHSADSAPIGASKRLPPEDLPEV